MQGCVQGQHNIAMLQKVRTPGETEEPDFLLSHFTHREWQSAPYLKRPADSQKIPYESESLPDSDFLSPASGCTEITASHQADDLRFCLLFLIFSISESSVSPSTGTLHPDFFCTTSNLVFPVFCITGNFRKFLHSLDCCVLSLFIQRIQRLAQAVCSLLPQNDLDTINRNIPCG